MGLKNSKPNLIALLLKDARAAFDEGYYDCADVWVGRVEVIVANPISNLTVIAMIARLSFDHGIGCLT